MLENINSEIEGLISIGKTQFNFNKIIGTQFAQIVIAIHVNNSGRIPRQPEKVLEKVRT